MKVLWIVNKVFPYPANKIGISNNVFGGWLNGLANKLKDNNNIELAIATVYNGKEIQEYNDGKITYYLIPGAPATKYKKKFEFYWKEIDKRFHPDLVHVHGTEYTHGLAFLNACPKVKSITSIQGLVSVYSDVYLGNIDTKQIIKNITLRDMIKFDSILQQKNKMKKSGFFEIETLKKSNVILGRTTWDYANSKAIVGEKKFNYIKSNETLRESFYGQKWNPENIQRNTIFCSQGNYPIKGLHYLLKAICILKQVNTDIKLYVAGTNIINNTSLKNRLKRTGYAKYIIKLIDKYKIKDNVEFLGVLNEDEMRKHMLKSNVFVLSSAIENSSNSLGEAMLMGMPCVAANTGGTPDMLEHKKEGFLYPYTEPAILAEYILEYLNDDSLCMEYGKNASVRANERHNPNKNLEEIIEIYKKTI